MKLLIYSLKIPTAKIRLPKPFGNKKRRQGAFNFLFLEAFLPPLPRKVKPF
tara:strand:+ start:430 stop:582 length:153 start_codon:yes stop_codon:yes gene_type:complete